MIASSKYTIVDISIATGINDIEKKSYPIVLDDLDGIIIQESLDKKGLMGSISFLDNKNYNDTVPIIGGEYIEISLKDILGNKFKQTFIVVQKESVEKRDKTNKISLNLDIVEVSYFDILTKSFPFGIPDNVKTTTDIINFMIEKIAPTYKNVLDTDSKQIKNNVDNIYFPTIWNIDLIIDYLISKNDVDGNAGFYFLFDKNSSKYKFLSSTDFETKDVLHYFQLTQREQFDYVKNYKVLPSIDNIHASNSHVINSTVTTADLNNKNIETYEFKLNDYLKKYNFKESLISSESENMSSNNYNFYTYKPYLYNKNIEIEVDNYISKYFREQHTMMVEINGRLDLNLGDKLYLEWTRTPQTSYEVYAGTWIVNAITHVFSADSEYTQQVIISKSSFLPYEKDNRIFELS